VKCIIDRISSFVSLGFQLRLLVVFKSWLLRVRYFIITNCTYINYLQHVLN
jgi:hypothetical protein